VIVAGFAGILAIANEKTDHLWIVLTEETMDSLAVLVMLTDVRNIESPSLVLDAALALTDAFTLTKPSTIDFARSRKLEWSVLRYLISGSNFIAKGTVNPHNLGAVRQALLNSPHTPVDVLEFCRSCKW
jgi:hypothetical protein